MKYKCFLQTFTDGSEGGDDKGSGKAGKGGYSFEQAEEIANARAQRAEKAALSSYFKQQGMSEEEVTQALADFKAKKEAGRPNLTALQEENENLKKQIAETNNKNVLTTKGVRAEYMDYVMYEVSKKVTDKVSFQKAAEDFLKENPMYTGGTMKVSTGSKTGSTGAADGNDGINAAIRRAARR